MVANLGDFLCNCRTTYRDVATGDTYGNFNFILAIFWYPPISLLLTLQGGPSNI